MANTEEIFRKLPFLKTAVDRNQVRETNRSLVPGEERERQFCGSVVRSWEFKRIEKLPRRRLDLSEVPDCSPLYVHEGSPHSLRPVQSAALIEASEHGGLFGMIKVGEGKTLIALLLPDAMESERWVYLVKPDLKRQLEREIDEFYRQHFKVPMEGLHIIAYSELSSATKADILDEIKPDLIIADEAHSLKRKQSARTKRFLRYMQENPGTRFVALSGTMTTRSLHDYAHLIELALRKNNPLPISYPELQAWAGVLDVDPPSRYHPGALIRFCEDGETVEEGFRRRLTETPGVVATAASDVGSSLLIQPRQVRVPSRILEMMAAVDRTWELRDDENDYAEELTEASELWRVKRQLACGFYYVWDWGEDGPDEEWLEARRNWHREVRQALKRARRGLDAPLLLANAAERYYQWKNEGADQPDVYFASEFWPAWREQKDKPPPPVKPIWVDDFMVRTVVSWASKVNEPSIIWYEHRCLGEALGDHFPFYGPGDDASVADEPIIVCSIRAQGTGKNLQRYCRNLFTSLPPNGSKFEQTVGRTHRLGQLADEVFVEYLQHAGEESFEQIRADAEYVEKTTGDRQRVLYANWLDPKGLRY